MKSLLVMDWRLTRVRKATRGRVALHKLAQKLEVSALIFALPASRGGKLWECAASSHRFQSARQVSCRRCEQSHPRRVHCNLHFSALLLCALQLASPPRGNNHRSDSCGKISEKIVDLSRQQAGQALSNRFGAKSFRRETGRRRHENTGRNLQG